MHFSHRARVYPCAIAIAVNMSIWAITLECDYNPWS